MRIGLLACCLTAVAGCKEQNQKSRLSTVQPVAPAAPSQLNAVSDSLARREQLWSFVEGFPGRRSALIALLGTPDSSEQHRFKDPNEDEDSMITLYYPGLRFSFFQSATDSSNEFITRVELTQVRPIPVLVIGGPCASVRSSLGAPYQDTTTGDMRKLSYEIPENSTMIISCDHGLIAKISWLPYWD